jgi:hypothetical protein
MLRPKYVKQARAKLSAGDTTGYYETLKKNEGLSPLAQKEYADFKNKKTGNKPTSSSKSGAQLKKEGVAMKAKGAAMKTDGKTLKSAGKILKNMGSATTKMQKGGAKPKNETPFQGYMKNKGATASDTTMQQVTPKSKIDIRIKAPVAKNPKNQSSLDNAFEKTYGQGYMRDSGYPSKGETLEQYKRRMGPMKKGGAMKKMKVGGMVNSNTKLVASKVAKGRVGGTSSAPKTAVPKAKMGMSMKSKKSC